MWGAFNYDGEQIPHRKHYWQHEILGHVSLSEQQLCEPFIYMMDSRLSLGAPVKLGSIFMSQSPSLVSS